MKDGFDVAERQFRVPRGFALRQQQQPTTTQTFVTAAVRWSVWQLRGEENRKKLCRGMVWTVSVWKRVLENIRKDGGVFFVGYKKFAFCGVACQMR